MSPRWTSSGVAVAAVLIDLAIWGGDTELRMGGSIPMVIVVVAAMAAYATLAVSHRHPLFAFGTLWSFSLVGLVLPSYEAFVGMLAALYAVARHCPRSVAVLALVFCLVPVGTNVANSSGYQPDPSLIGSVIIAALWLLLFATVWGVGRAAWRSANRSKDHVAALARAAEEARRLERVAIARELHDSVAHTLSAVVLQAAGARTVCQRGPAPQRAVIDGLQAIERSGSQAMRELHRLLGLLREGDSAAADGTEPAAITHTLDELPDLIETTRSSGLEVTVTAQGTPATLDPSIAHAAYRFAQETFANAMRHAGAGGSLSLRLCWRCDGLVLTALSIDGPDPPALPIKGGHGLAGLEERVRLLGGHLRATRTPNGFLTEAQLPATRRTITDRKEAQ